MKGKKMNTETFGQIEAVSRWLNGERIEVFIKHCEVWLPVPHFSISKTKEIPIELLSSQREYRLALSVLQFPAPPEGEKWHNPDNLTPEQVEIDKGYRLRLESEKVGNSDEFWLTIGAWSKTLHSGYNLEAVYTYRTREPLLVKEKPSQQEQLWICESASHCPYQTGTCTHQTHHERFDACVTECIRGGGIHGSKCIPVPPAPKMTELGPEDVPPGSVVRMLNEDGWCNIVFVSKDRIMIANGGSSITYSALREQYEILRPGEDWKPCEKEAAQ